MNITFHSTELHLLAEKAIFIPSEKALIIGDVHIGKTMDLQREGVRIPDSVGRRNIERLFDLLKGHGPQTCYFLGDLFHSWSNPEFVLFQELIHRFPSIQFILIRGNHEKMKDEEYQKLGLEVFKEHTIGDITLRHHPDTESDSPSISAHIHPKVRLSGRGRQSLVCPAFVQQGQCLIVPAFGELTGGYKVDVKQMKATYIVAEDLVLPYR